VLRAILRTRSPGNVASVAWSKCAGHPPGVANNASHEKQSRYQITYSAEGSRRSPIDRLPSHRTVNLYQSKMFSALSSVTYGKGGSMRTHRFCIERRREKHSGCPNSEKLSKIQTNHCKFAGG
jgi:hypothetical protein